MKSGVLYISYSGMLEPLGQSQVLAYQERLASDHEVHLISFEKAEDWARYDERQVVQARMDKAGIRWHPLRYHKRFSAVSTAWDILRGAAKGLRQVRKHRLVIVHARSYVSAAMALIIKRTSQVQFLFDMRGFWADERVDGGLWPCDGRMYRIAKWFERQFLASADHVVSLTHAGVEVMSKFDYLKGRMPRMTVIPTCADLDRFRPCYRPEDTGTQFTLGYVGSAGTWYMFDAVAMCFRYLQELRPESRLLVINRNEHDYIRDRLEVAGVSSESVEIREATHMEVPAQMARMDAGIFFIRPAFSKQASAPTKLGEMLGCGLPVLANSGVGDMAAILRRDHVGVAVDAMEETALKRGVRELLSLCAKPETKERCVASARRNFSLETGVREYRAIYASMTDGVSK